MFVLFSFQILKNNNLLYSITPFKSYIMINRYRRALSSSVPVIPTAQKVQRAGQRVQGQQGNIVKRKKKKTIQF